MAKKDGRGNIKLSEQIRRLKKGMDEAQITKAEKLAVKDPNVAKLAFKLINKKPHGSQLPKKQQDVYEELLKRSTQKIADDYRQEALAAKAKP